ncbi:MAG: hypothetical protein JNG88_19920 [Phycisphaerales bacterium]|nr:hypothetical protein [Phycisphaerales bacterium]
MALKNVWLFGARVVVVMTKLSHPATELSTSVSTPTAAGSQFWTKMGVMAMAAGSNAVVVITRLSQP